MSRASRPSRCARSMRPGTSGELPVVGGWACAHTQAATQAQVETMLYSMFAFFCMCWVRERMLHSGEWSDIGLTVFLSACMDAGYEHTREPKPQPVARPPPRHTPRPLRLLLAVRGRAAYAQPRFLRCELPKKGFSAAAPPPLLAPAADSTAAPSWPAWRPRAPARA